MKNTLQDEGKFKQLEEDPRSRIKQLIKGTMCKYADEDLISKDELFSITGITAKGGMSKGHEFVVKKP